MRINQLEILGQGTARGDSAFVLLHTDAGHVGLAEARLSNRTALLPVYLRSIASEIVIGSDPFSTEALVARILRHEGPRISPLAATAASLLEVACWDLIGKALDVPVYRLLGGAVRNQIPAYASGWAPVDAANDAIAAAARRTAALGFRALAFDPFPGLEGRDPTPAEVRAAARRAEAVRAAVGPDLELLIELRGRLAPAAAIRFGRALDRVQPVWIADPIRDGHPSALSAVNRKVLPSLAVGENHYHRADFLELLARGACSVIQPELASCCGFLETRKLAALAESYGAAVALRQSAGPAAAAASLHLAATLPNLLRIEMRLGATGPQAVTGCPEFLQGAYMLPQGPGLGVTLDRALLAGQPPGSP